VKEGVFREDLFHRLNVIRLRVPSLRERREDIPLLAKHFLIQSAKQLGVDAKRLSDSALTYISGLEFPGNVRQLENLCNWITVMAPGQVVEVVDLPSELLPMATSNAAVEVGARVPNHAAISMQTENFWLSSLEHEAERLLQQGGQEIMSKLSRDFESVVIKAALRHTHGRKNEAAIRLGIGRNTISRKIQELSIDGVREE
jgi:two-component system nitrogen regulation response regulator GlnG